MQANDFDNFARVLDAAYSLHSKSLSADARSLFFAALSDYSLADVRRAFSAHIKDPERGQYPPKPADLIAQLRPAPESDGRPGADEAWSIAIRALDERNTVVWTAEISRAWTEISHLAHGDETAARMAFRGVYTRLLDAARATGTPAKWTPTLGWDVEQREQVVGESVRAGRLSITAARAAVPMLAGPDTEPKSEGATQQIAKLHRMIEGIGSAQERAAEVRSARVRESAEQLAEAKREAAARVAEYERSHT